MGIEQLRTAEFSAKDMLIGITASGFSPYVLGALRYAHSIGSITAALSCNKEACTFKIADYAVFLPVGPEIITGSTRMKAGTAQKLVLNMISTTAMIKLGKVYNNFMIDLMPLNTIDEITGCGAITAAQIFDASGGKIRTAVVMAALHVTRNEAERLLQKGKNNINAAFKIYNEEGQ